MQYRSVKGISGQGQLGVLLLFTGLGLVLAMLFQYLIGLLLLGHVMPMEKMQQAVIEAMKKPENLGYARLSQISGTFFMLFLPAVLYLFVCHGRNSFWLGFNKYINYKQIMIGFFLIFCAGIIAGPLADLSKNLFTHFPALEISAKQMETSYNSQVIALSNLKSWGEFLMAIVIMAFFPALFEEIFFRGALQNILERWWKAPLLAVLVSAVLFSVIHMSFYLFLSRALLGFILGLMYMQSKNIWVNIGAHFLNNLVALIQLFWISRHGQIVEVDKLDPNLPLWGVFIALVFASGIFILFKKVSEKNRMLIAFEEQNLMEKQETGYTSK